MFEIIYQTDPSREVKTEIESGRIELSDQELLQRVRLNEGFTDAGFTFKTPDEDSMSPILKDKFKKAREITKDTKVIDLRNKDAKSKSKSSKRAAKKNNPKSH